MENCGLIVFFFMFLAVVLMWIINANQGSNPSGQVRNRDQSTFDNFSGDHTINSFFDSYSSTEYDKDSSGGDSSGGDSSSSDSSGGDSE